jgi:hypothetical protein
MSRNSTTIAFSRSGGDKARIVYKFRPAVTEFEKFGTIDNSNASILDEMAKKEKEERKTKKRKVEEVVEEEENIGEVVEVNDMAESQEEVEVESSETDNEESEQASESESETEAAQDKV